jgi:hypothetical protein
LDGRLVTLSGMIEARAGRRRNLAMSEKTKFGRTWGG